MSETPETDAKAFFVDMGEEIQAADGPYVRSVDHADLEIDRNRWRSAAEQAEKALEVIASGCIKKEFAGGAVSAPEATREYMMMLAGKALAAFDSLRKEEK